MLRKTLTILSLIGLLLSLVLWGVSIRYYSAFISQSLTFQVGMEDGVLSFFWPEKRKFIAVRMTAGQAEAAEVYDAFARFHYVKMPWPRHHGFRLPMIKREYIGRTFHIPLWIPTLLFAVILRLCHPLHYHRRRERKKLGLCLKCGYDLRGSSERCPECGQEFGETCSARP